MALPFEIGRVQFAFNVSTEGQDLIEDLVKKLYDQGILSRYRWRADMLVVEFIDMQGFSRFYEGYNNLRRAHGKQPRQSGIYIFLALMGGQNQFSFAVKNVLDKYGVALVDLLELRGRMHHQ